MAATRGQGHLPRVMTEVARWTKASAARGLQFSPDGGWRRTKPAGFEGQPGVIFEQYCESTFPWVLRATSVRFLITRRQGSRGGLPAESSVSNE